MSMPTFARDVKTLARLVRDITSNEHRSEWTLIVLLRILDVQVRTTDKDLQHAVLKGTELYHAAFAFLRAIILSCRCFP